MEAILNRKKFFGWAVKLALPIMVQNLISTLVSTADTVMLGFVNQTAMSASSLANEYTFVLFCFYYGLATATSVMCAQYYGKGDKSAVERIMGLAARLSILISALFFVVSFFFPREIMLLFTNSEPTIEAGIEYLRIISFSFIFMGFSQVYVSALRSVGKVFFPSLVYVVSLCVNVFFNAAFIFGFLFFPEMGVKGVAIGTLIARFVEAMMCLIHSVVNKDIKFRVRYIFAKSGALFGDFIKIGFPSIANDVVWSLATSVFASILGHMGDDMVAANAVAIMVVNIGAIACRGFAGATTIVLSQSLGANNMKGTKVYSKRMLLITIGVSLVGCLIIVAIRPLVVAFYADKLTPTAISYLGTIMLMTTWRLVGEGINTCLICGCFRAGGDSKFGLILDTFSMWCVAVPIMALAAYVFKLSPLWVYFTMTLDEFEKMPVVFIHYFKFKWMKNITRESIE